MPPTKIEILSTKPLSQPILSKALENSIVIDVMPFIKTEPVTGETIKKEIQEWANRNVAAVFTSLNAVEAIVSQLTFKPHWDIYCMGGVTKEGVIHFFGNNAIKATARNAAHLAEKIISAHIDKEIVFFCSNHRLDKLPGILKANAVSFQEQIVYNTIETPHFIEKNYRAIIFFSPSAVHSFFSENTIATDVLLFSIGKTTAETIATYVSNKIISSEWPGQEHLIDQVIDYYNTLQQKGYEL